MTGVLVVFGGYARGSTSGAERMAWRTTGLLAARGHVVAGLTDADRPRDTDGAAWPVYESIVSLRYGLPAWRPDVVHAYNLAIPGHVTLAAQLARHYGALFAITPASAAATWPSSHDVRSPCEQADIVYLLSPAEAGPVVAMGADPRCLRHLPQAPDLTGRPDPARFRREHALDGPVVLFIGRKVAAKGYQVLLDAAPLVWPHAPATFVFAGPDGEPEAAAAFAARPDRRLLDLGMVDDQTKHDALAACDIVCLPTRADVFPLVFAEAWACGKAVISGDFAGVHDVLRDGVDGVVVPPDPRAVASALVRLLADDQTRQRIGMAGLARVRAEMTWDKVADAVEAGYRRDSPPVSALPGRR